MTHRPMVSNICAHTHKKSTDSTLLLVQGGHSWLAPVLEFVKV